MVVEKVDVRKKLLKKRQSLPLEIKTQYDRQIISNLRFLREFRDADRILLYCPIKGEPDLSSLFGKLLDEGKGLVLPRVRGNELELVSVKTHLCLARGAFNIPEPDGGEVLLPGEVGLAVVPGIAFDREGYRIGFGKGYYDRLLEGVSAPKVGVAYSFQVLERVPRDSWDKPVNILVTEKEVIRRY